MTTNTNKNQNNSTVTETVTPKERNTIMKTSATPALISLPASLQQAYTNHRMFINEHNEIIKCSDISSHIQIIWITTDLTYFITTYKTKSKQTIPGSYKTSITQNKDYLQDYLIHPFLKQKGLTTKDFPGKASLNNQVITYILKDQVYIDFNIHQNLSEKGNAYNTYTVSY